MEDFLNADRCHGGESGTGRGGRFPEAARCPRVDSEAERGLSLLFLAGLWRSSPSRALLDSGSRTQIRNSCGWIEKKENESKTAWEAVHRCLFPIGEMGKP